MNNRFAWILLCGMSLSACGGTPPAQPASNATTQAQDATYREGDITMHATAIATSALNDSVAREYEIASDPNRVMLLVALRKDGNDTPISALMQAHATNLRGSQQAIEMRPITTADGLQDYVGLAEIVPPDTLRFDVTVNRADAPPVAMQFSRTFYP